MSAIDAEAKKPEVWTLTSELEGERASSFRQGRWCRVLIDAGFRLTAFNLRGALGLSQNTFADLAAFEDFLVQVKANARPMASVREGLIVRLLRHLKHLILIDLWLPNVWRLLFAVLRRLRRTNGRVVIMASSPPFSVAVVGAIVKMLRPRRVELVVDMRDAWALHTGLGGIRPLKRLIERWVLRRADDVLTVSHGLSREFCDVHGLPSVTVLYNVATHYFQVPDPEPVNWSDFNPAIRSDSRKFIYTGSTPEGHFALGTIVAGVKAAMQRGLTASRLQLIFIGACDALMREVKRQGDCEDLIVFVSHQPHRVAQCLQQRADGLIFLAYDGAGNKGVVSTKFFEYLALQKPIIPFSVREGSDIELLLRKFAGNSLSLNELEEIANVLIDNVEHQSEVFLPVCENAQALTVLHDEYYRRAEVFLKKVNAVRSEMSNVPA